MLKLGVNLRTIAVTSAYSMSVFDDIVNADATSASFSVTLPDATQCSGKAVVISKTDSGTNAITVLGLGSQTIDNSTTGIALIQQGSAHAFVAVNGNWFTTSLSFISAQNMVRGLKNYLINGAMDFAQRVGNGNAVNLTGSAAYYLDRWQTYYTGSWSVTPQISQTYFNNAVPTDSLASYSMNIGGTPSSTSSAFVSQQKIESIHAAELAGKRISVGLWAYAYNVGSQLSLNLFYPSAVDNYGTSTSIYTSSPSSLTVGAWKYLQFNNILVPNAAVSGLAMALSVSNFSATGSSCGVFISEVMLNQGFVANSFTRMGGNIVHELDLCQRYYEKTYDVSVAPGTSTRAGMVGWGYTGAAFANIGLFTPFNTVKRAAANVSIYGASGTVGNYFNGSSDVPFATTPGGGWSNSTKGLNWGNNTTSSLQNFFVHYTADSEIG